MKGIGGLANRFRLHWNVIKLVSLIESDPIVFYRIQRILVNITIFDVISGIPGNSNYAKVYKDQDCLLGYVYHSMQRQAG